MVAVESSPLVMPGAEESGGANVYVHAIAHELSRHGVASDIYTRATDSTRPPVVTLEPGVRVIHVPAGPRTRLPKNQLAPLLKGFSREVVHIAHDLDRYDVLSSHCWLSGQVALWLRERWDIPMVHHPHSLGLERNSVVTPSEPPWHPDQVMQEHRIIGGADLLIAASQSERDDLVGLYGAAREKVRVVASGVDHDRFSPGDQQAARGRLEIKSRYLLLYVGRLHRIKGIDLAIRTVAELARSWPELDIELLVVGGSAGEQHELRALHGLVNQEGVAGRIRFLDAQPHSALPAIYQSADLLLMPSRSEPFGLVALEAQACGTPVVAARVGGLGEVVSDGITGVLLTEREPAAYATVIAELLQREPRLRAMRMAAVEHSNRFQWRSTVTELLAAYNEALAPLPHERYAS